MSLITLRAATDDEQKKFQAWDLWESGEADRFEYTYDQGVCFVVQSGEAGHSIFHKLV